MSQTTGPKSRGRSKNNVHADLHRHSPGDAVIGTHRDRTQAAHSPDAGRRLDLAPQLLLEDWYRFVPTDVSPHEKVVQQ